MVEAGLYKAGQWRGVNVRLVLVIEASDQTRQHAGIGRVDLPRDQREAHARHWVHAESAQHANVRVPGPEEDHVLEHRRWRGLHAMTARFQRECDAALNWCCRGPTTTSDVKVELSANCLRHLWSSEQQELSVYGPLPIRSWIVPDDFRPPRRA